MPAFVWDEKSKSRIRKLYETFAMPTDRLAANRGKLVEFTQRFNAKQKTSATASEVIEKLIKMRKAGDLPRLIVGKKGTTSAVEKSPKRSSRRKMPESIEQTESTS